MWDLGFTQCNLKIGSTGILKYNILMDTIYIYVYSTMNDGRKLQEQDS